MYNPKPEKRAGPPFSPTEAKTLTQRQKGGALLDGKIALWGALLQANLQIWPQRGGGGADGEPMSKMGQSRFFGGEILTTP
jgi:hypothetical protein